MHDWPRSVLVTLVAPEVVTEAEQLGAGQTWSGTLGGVRDSRFGIPIPLTATIERLFSARFILNGHLGRNLPIDMGRAAVLRAGEVRVFVTSRSGPHFAPELFQAAGFDPFAAAVVVAKSPAGFRAGYEPRAAGIYSVRAPGCAPSHFWEYDYRHRPQPLWPWEQSLDWTPQVLHIDSRRGRS
jgi:microcystin degradation protein MlrC